MTRNPGMKLFTGFFIAAAPIEVTITKTRNSLVRDQKAPAPQGKAFENSVHRASLGTAGSKAAKARINSSQPIQQAHQSSFFHNEVQSIPLLFAMCSSY